MPSYLTWRSICIGRRFAYVSLEPLVSEAKSKRSPGAMDCASHQGTCLFQTGASVRLYYTVLYCIVLYCVILVLAFVPVLYIALQKAFPGLFLEKGHSQKDPQNPSPFAAGSEICSNNVRQILSAFPFFYTLHGRVFSRFPAS